MNWTENNIARALALQTFKRKGVVIVPNCNWTGRECDLLVVEPGLRIIDVEIKISRSDLKADAKKDKWWTFPLWHELVERGVITREERWDPWKHKEPAMWPPKVWKHYYALPAEIWDDSLLDCLPSIASGVLVLSSSQRLGYQSEITATVVRRATPKQDAEKLTPAQAVDVARLANLRYWDAAIGLEKARVEIADRKAVEAPGLA